MRQHMFDRALEPLNERLRAKYDGRASVIYHRNWLWLLLDEGRKGRLRVADVSDIAGGSVRELQKALAEREADILERAEGLA
ncbi:hypothetical protein [Alloyangia pacifica]|uniref:Uncharacterized protein n=1 Tax=Alloyangia pacifica TaxID=311180 RepID=A0A1I6PR08_9RHOB|nr:hypothetical protein [Alloyangia pacifica]SDG33359.1 hypothetical protein SAMN04488245_102401 [Alloyangia pacifica]SFS42498.1 hypothetical protein SAMN04488050_101702 [Alloyangia pacifica]